MHSTIKTHQSSPTLSTPLAFIRIFDAKKWSNVVIIEKKCPKCSIISKTIFIFVTTKQQQSIPHPSNHYQYGKNPCITQAQLRTASVDWRDREPF